ncbi:MAG: M23 family metallopeptidase [Desulfobacteraceae bacterium]|jgi:murein DD-endopeptidase MepM/ murein hydrolase activator NlpD
MFKRYIVIIADKSGRPLKKTSVSTYLIFTTFLFGLILLSSIGFLGYHYHNVKKENLKIVTLQSKISWQTEEIRGQRRQIQAFANEINGLKGRMFRLDEVEKQIKTLANLSVDSDKNEVHGIGGSIPDDLDPNLDLTRKHDQLVRNMHEQVAQLQNASIQKENDLKYLMQKLEERRNILSATPSILPTQGEITSRFGYRRSPFTGRSELHKGIDIANKKGTPIVAPASGVLIFVGMRGTFGRIMTIDHGHGIITHYAHLDKTLKKEGERVKRGDVIAMMGNSGRSTGPHLHYEVRLNGVPVNPAKYIGQ